MRHSKRLTLFAVFVVAFLFVFTLPTLAAVGLPRGEETYRFLRELAGLQEIPGFPPELFTPEREPGRFEIALFLFRFDEALAARAVARRLDLVGALAALWAGAHPGTGHEAAVAWAERAALSYRYLLLEYHREMSALGYRLRADAYPQWVGGGTNVSGR